MEGRVGRTRVDGDESNFLQRVVIVDMNQPFGSISYTTRCRIANNTLSYLQRVVVRLSVISECSVSAYLRRIVNKYR